MSRQGSACRPSCTEPTHPFDGCRVAGIPSPNKTCKFKLPTPVSPRMFRKAAELLRPRNHRKCRSTKSSAIRSAKRNEKAAGGLDRVVSMNGKKMLQIAKVIRAPRPKMTIDMLGSREKLAPDGDPLADQAIPT